MRMGESVEVILQNREALELTDAQVSELETIQAELGVASEPFLAEMQEFRKAMQAGEITQEEARESRSEWQRRGSELMKPFQDRIHGVLTEEQHTRLEPLMQEQMRQGRRGGGPRGPGAALGQAYQDGYRAGLRATRGGRGQGGQRSLGLHRRGRTAAPDTSGVSSPLGLT